MDEVTATDVLPIARGFDTPGAPLTSKPYGSGYINDTHLVECERGAIILQRINTTVFHEPEQVMENIARVTEHIARGLGASSPPVAGHPARRLTDSSDRDAQRRALSLVPLKKGGFLLRRGLRASAQRVSDRDEYWRAFHLIPNAVSLDIPRTPADVFEAARAFARFTVALADLPAPRLHETIPHFHDTPARFEAFTAALAKDPHNRSATARDVIDALLARRSLADVILSRLENGDLVERVVHNDTKLNNVLLDAATGEALCVIDLDTVMPGLFLYDFGDMVRSVTNPAAEDERDLTKVSVSLPMFEAVVRGTLAELKPSLVECQLLPVAGAVVTYEQTLRFLTDHILGDLYYRIHRPGQNLDRARTHLALLVSMEQRRGDLEEIVVRAT